jgi:hypothetical protein
VRSKKPESLAAGMRLKRFMTFVSMSFLASNPDASYHRR